MQINLPSDIESIAQAAVTSGAYESVADFIAAAVKDSSVYASATQTNGATASSQVAFEEWNKRFSQFLDQQVTTNPNFDDSRESMYPDR